MCYAGIFLHAVSEHGGYWQMRSSCSMKKVRVAGSIHPSAQPLGSLNFRVFGIGNSLFAKLIKDENYVNFYSRQRSVA